VRIRSDAKWSVPEPELTLLINPRGQIIGYTVGNDMSSRDIEGENPLYLPQAKVYDRSCALGPCILVSSEPLPTTTPIRIEICAAVVRFSGATTLAELKRDPADLAEYLFRENSFPFGVFLMTGTGIVPPDDFTLRSGRQNSHHHRPHRHARKRRCAGKTHPGRLIPKRSQPRSQQGDH
jgi:2-dehydro-3-deoxy-D-arabinonate dehydratase